MLYKKRIAKALVMIGLVTLLTAGTAFASYGTAVVSTYALRLREQPNTSCATLTTLTEGTAVTLLSGEENGWYKVSYKNYVGYMSAEYLTVTSFNTDTPTEETPDEEVVITGSSSAQNVHDPLAFRAVVNAGPLNVRSGPGTDYSRIGSLEKGTSINVIGISGEWYKIQSGSLTGYVFAEYVTKTESIAVTPPATNPNSSGDRYAFTPDASVAQEAIVLRNLNIRSGPGAQYVLLGKLNVGVKMTIYNKVNGWYQMTCGDYQGYVHADYIIRSEDLKSSPVGAAAAEMAKSLLGCRYVYGAEGPTTFDCSGLSYYIYGQLGYPIARGSSGQYLRSGYFVPMTEMEPGDLIFIYDPKYDYSNGEYPTTHMGIYVGDGKFIHASTTSNSVQYDNVYNSYYTKYIVGVKRIG